MSLSPTLVLPWPAPGWLPPAEFLLLTPIPAFAAIEAGPPVAPPALAEAFTPRGLPVPTTAGHADAAPGRPGEAPGADPLPESLPPLPAPLAGEGASAEAPIEGQRPGEASAEPAAPPPEDAFPTIEELDAILAAHAGPPPVPDLATRIEVAAALGLDPAIAEDADLFIATLSGLAPAEAEPLPVEEDVSAPETAAWPWPALGGDWALA